MPNILVRQQVAVNSTDAASAPSTTSSGVQVKPWVIAVIVTGSVLVVAVCVFFIVRFVRRRNYRRAQALEPFLSPKEFQRRRKMSEADKMEEAEVQRSILIRKSLASRSSLLNRNSQSVASNYSLDPDYDELPDGGFKMEWKEFEARATRERNSSGERHPSVYYADGEVPDLSIPEPTLQRNHVFGAQTPAMRSTSTFGPTPPRTAGSQDSEGPPPSVIVPLVARAVTIRHERGPSLVSRGPSLVSRGPSSASR